MSLMDQIKSKAKADIKHILLPEGAEERTVQAAAKIVEQGIAKVTLLGDPDEIAAVAKKFAVSLDGVGIVNPLTDADLDKYIGLFYELRKEKGVDMEKAAKMMKTTLFCGLPES